MEEQWLVFFFVCFFCFKANQGEHLGLGWETTSTEGEKLPLWAVYAHFPGHKTHLNEWGLPWTICALGPAGLGKEKKILFAGCITAKKTWLFLLLWGGWSHRLANVLKVSISKRAVVGFFSPFLEVSIVLITALLLFFFFFLTKLRMTSQPAI